MKKLPKTRSVRSLAGTGLKLILLAEGAALIGSYLVWRSMNTSQEFRFKVHQNFPVLLESYYWMGESLGQLQTRQQDYQAWGLPPKPHS